jgi:hypothetical protein
MRSLFAFAPVSAYARSSQVPRTSVMPTALLATRFVFVCVQVMPRGQVLSIAEINMKLEEDAAAGRRSARDGVDKKPEGPKKGNTGGKKVDVSSQDAFPTLGGAKAAPKA